MHLMFCDETNTEELPHVQFFIYGGLVIDAENVEALCSDVADIRERAGFDSQASLKFQAASRPPQVPRDTWNTAKGEVVDASREAGCRFIAVLVHHSIADKAHRTEWQLNLVLKAYDQLLRKEDDVGLFIMDRLSGGEEYALMAERFRLGSTTPWGARRVYRKVVGYAATCDGASHLASAADVTLGTFAYCVNERREGVTRPAELFPRIEPMIWRGNFGEAWSKGLILTPADPYAYRTEYRLLREHLGGIGLAH